MIRIRVYRTVDELNTCYEYASGHVQVLKDYGIENITSNNNEWMYNQNIYCVIAIDNDNEMVGGIRLQIGDGISPLPVETAIGDIDPGIYKVVEYYHKNGGIGELCGLWNSRKVKGVGISVVLVRAAISIINQLKFQTLTGICAEYSLKMFQEVGFVINERLGNEGKFVYPNENYIARVVGILNSLTLATAAPYDRKIMLNLRDCPVQSRIESGPKGNFNVNYDLNVKINTSNIGKALKHTI